MTHPAPTNSSAAPSGAASSALSLRSAKDSASADARAESSSVKKSPVPEGPQGRFVDRDGERFYAIEDADQMPVFFTCIVSSSDAYLFASSNGCLTCGRQNSSKALFPYVTEDKIHDNVETTGPYTAVQIGLGAESRLDSPALWEPFRNSSSLLYKIRRHLYKNAIGDKLCFEEVNLSLGLSFSYTWQTSERYGFVRHCRLENHGDTEREVRILDGVQNLLPACVNEQIQLGFSVLLDAYKMNEAVGEGGLAVYNLGSQVVDRATPMEALRGSIAYGIDLTDPESRSEILVSSAQLASFQRGDSVTSERLVRGKRGAYFTQRRAHLAKGESREWLLVLDVDRTQAEVAEIEVALRTKSTLSRDVLNDVERGSRALRDVVARTDGLQLSGDERATSHHFFNTLFNDLRGGVYADDYRLSGPHFRAFVATANKRVASTHQERLSALSEELLHKDLLAAAAASEDPDLERLAYEYLPLTFSRRHGDPSRPWNKFDIQVRSREGTRLLGFQGNWRDIFQNWEALGLSYPGYVESIICKFLNASTADGYNPYRITHAGIDWEEPEPENPWAGIGYWGDHQIIYLQKLLEQSREHHPLALTGLLSRALFTYANVPYRIKPYGDLIRDPRETISFDHAENKRIHAKCEEIGSDGRLLMSAPSGHTGDLEPYRVNLTEKLLVTSLAKMGNFIPGGGIWLNTQRPEWNDANNALVGYGVSMVTLYYCARYFRFLEEILAPLTGERVELSLEVAAWLTATVRALEGRSGKSDPPLSAREAARVSPQWLARTTDDDGARRELADALGSASSDYRQQVYLSGFRGKAQCSGDTLLAYVKLARVHLEHTISRSRRSDGLFHAYNLLAFGEGSVLSVEPLYEMLEGQVAALSAGVLGSEEVLGTLKSLRESAMYREDQDSYLLYPSRQLPTFLEKNRVSMEQLATSSLLSKALQAKSSVILKDQTGVVRFGPDISNATLLREALLRLAAERDISYSEEELQNALSVYESAFHHRSFTGRSGTMFGYEGLGSIYWHMVAKLLLAVQENFFIAEERGDSPEQLRALYARYYEIREGVGGFNKTPKVYGAFPMDPYSHTPENSGARQPGMTGQVKEEILTRFGELGVRVKAGRVRFSPSLLRQSEFLSEPASLSLLRLDGSTEVLHIPRGSLAFTYCQVPIVYESSTLPGMTLTLMTGETVNVPENQLSEEHSREIFERSCVIRRIDVRVAAGLS